MLLPLERLAEEGQETRGRHHRHLPGQRLRDGRATSLLGAAVRVRLARVEVRASKKVLCKKKTVPDCQIFS